MKGQKRMVNNNMSQEEYIPNEMDLGILGEIYNVSMGAAATAVSSLLRMKVDITAPIVEIVDREHLLYQPFEPAVGVEIKYIAGVEGINIFILSQMDVMKIVDIMLGGTGIVNESTEFNDMHMSAIGEVMNQMMGQSSMSLANFLNTPINISVPYTYKINDDFAPAKKEMTGKIISTKFKFVVGDIINSEMLTTCSMQFARSMIDMAKKHFGMSDSANSAHVQQIVESEINGPPPEIVKEKEIMKEKEPEIVFSDSDYDSDIKSEPRRSAKKSAAGNVSVRSAAYQSFDEQGGHHEPDTENNNLLGIVPVDVTVEIGKTKKLISEIMEFGEGSIIELDKQSADPVDILANGILVAKGTVVVTEEENFGVKITEIFIKNRK